MLSVREQCLAESGGAQLLLARKTGTPVDRPTDLARRRINGISQPGRRIESSGRHRAPDTGRRRLQLAGGRSVGRSILGQFSRLRAAGPARTNRAVDICRRTAISEHVCRFVGRQIAAADTYGRRILPTLPRAAASVAAAVMCSFQEDNRC